MKTSIGSILTAGAALLLCWPAAPAHADILYVSNAAADTIEKFDSAGAGSLFASSGLTSPTGLAFDNVGNLYVANADTATIEKFTPDGVGSLFASSGLSSPEYLAFTDNAGVPLKLANQVPEPSSLALAALAALRLCTVRRRSLS